MRVMIALYLIGENCNTLDFIEVATIKNTVVNIYLILYLAYEIAEYNHNHLKSNCLV